MSTDGLRQALNDSQRYLDVVQKQVLGKSEAEWLIDTTVNNFARYYNSGFIEYRKSVAEAGDFAAVEWTGHGATFRDVLGREYIDCLGGFGLFNLGWAHPKVVGAVQAQLQKSPLPTQELLDPLRGMLAHLLAEITPGDLTMWLNTMPVAPRTRERHRAYAIQVFNAATRIGLVTTNPAEDIPVFKNSKDEEISVLSPEQVQRLLECACEETKPLYAIAAFAGGTPKAKDIAAVPEISEEKLVDFVPLPVDSRRSFKLSSERNIQTRRKK